MTLPEGYEILGRRDPIHMEVAKKIGNKTIKDLQLAQRAGDPGFSTMILEIESRCFATVSAVQGENGPELKVDIEWTAR